MSDGLRSRLTPQREGPMASVPCTCFPITPHSRLDPQPLRVLLLRRLWLPFSQHATAGVACHKRFLWPPPSSLCCSRGAGSPGLLWWKVQLPVSVVKQGPGCLWTCLCRAGSGHHARVSPQTRPGSSRLGRKPQWCRAGHSSPSQSAKNKKKKKKGSCRESCIGGCQADNIVHRMCQEAPLKRFRVGPGLAEAAEHVVRFRGQEVHPMEEVFVTDWEAEAKALRQQIVELEGQRKSSVLSRVVASIPNSLPSKQVRWYRTRRQTTSLRRRSSIVSPTHLGLVRSIWS